MPLFILLLQTFWLPTILNHKVEMYIQGQNVPESNIHFIYIILEVIKVICLILYGTMQLRLSNL